MKKLTPTIAAHMLFNFMAVIALPVFADEDSNMLEADNKNSQSGGYLKLGLGYRGEVSPYHEERSGASFVVSGRYQWKNGLFIEAPGGANQLNPGFGFGYNFYNTEHWSFDVINQLSHGGVEYRARNRDGQSIDFARDATMSTGIRATGAIDQNTIQFTLLPYAYDSEFDNGLYASLWLAKQWQVKNWSIYSAIGFQYRSKELLNYYYGVAKDIAINGTPAYEAGAGVNSTIQFGLDYPITKNWVFESYVRYTQIASSMSDSPFIYNTRKFDDTRTKNVAEVAILLNYVF